MAIGATTRADILTIFDDRVAGRQVAQSHLVADRHGLADLQPEIAVVGRDDAQHRCGRRQILDHHDADIVLVIMHKQMRCTQPQAPP
ncbi:MAG: hypothetical protein WDN69_19385 [Aliidongia sp.]